MQRRLERLLVALSCIAVTGSSISAVAASNDKSGRTELHIRTTSRVVLRVVRLGRRSTKPPLILVSGWTVGLEVWDSVATELASDREVVLLDSRSQGGSTTTTADNRPEDRARDLAVVLRRLNISRPILIGWSQGAQDVAAYVRAFGDTNLAGCVLVDAAPSGGPKDLTHDPGEALKFFELLALYRSSPLDYQRGMMSFIIGDPARAELRERLARRGLKTPTTIGADMLVADLYGADRSNVRFSRPLLVLIAGRNPDPAPLKAWAESNHANVKVVANASHALFVDQPEQFVRAIKDFEAQVDEQ